MQKSGRVTEQQPAPTGTMAWVGFGCCVFAMACLSISFCSPYWIQTWPMSENAFRNMGLWHVCFNKYMQFKDDSQQLYSECWWVFDRSTKYYKLREWLIPPWFISCQVLTTGCLVVEIATSLITGLIFLHFCPLMNHEYLQTYGIFAAGSMMFLVTMVSFVVAILFGVQVNDRYWMPRPDQNYLSWGFGFLIISAICCLAAGVCLFKSAWDTYQELLRREDEYTKQALELSMFQTEQPMDQDYAVVQPGYSGMGMQPGYYEPEPVGPPTYGRPPSYTEAGVNVMPSKLREPETEKSWERKPLTEPSMERKPGFQTSFELEPVAPAATGIESPREGAYVQGYDQTAPYGRESGAFGKSYEQPAQPTTFGKSYDKSYERRYSNSSYSDGEQEMFTSKPERQY